MTIGESIILGAVQGFTEFLPISSSGHLVLVQHFLPGFFQPGVLFDAVLHIGTLLAVVVYFYKKLLSLTPRVIGLLLVASIPAALVGFLFKDLLESMFSNIFLLGVSFLITAVTNWFVDSKTNAQAREKITWLDAVIIGIAQAIAIIPAISRSGSTIFAGVMRGITKEEVATFSFLLSIPAVGGAVFLETAHWGFGKIEIVPYIIGTIISFVTGIISIKFLLNFLFTKRFRIFAVYCVVIGLTTILLTI